MIDNVRIAMERQISAENATVKSASVATRIKKEGEREGGNKNFKEMLKKDKKPEKKSIQVEAVKEPIEDDIIISNSLNKTIEEQRKISELVNEKFVENPSLRGKINFKK